MSADNGYVIRRHPNGGFIAVMYFASDESYPDVSIDRYPISYPSPQAAWNAVADEWTEYGVHYETGVRDVPFEEETCWTHDEKVDAWYFHLHPKSQNDPGVHRTQDLGGRHVLLDWSEDGQVIGIEVL